MKMHYLLRILPESWIWALENAALSLPASAKELFMVQTAARFRKTAGLRANTPA
jgi:hypothetical protein